MADSSDWKGKGKVAHWLAARREARIAIRVGGPNSGHTVVVNGRTWVLRQLPSPILRKGVVGVIAAGAYLDLAVLLDEVASTGDQQQTTIKEQQALIDQLRGDVAALRERVK